MLDVLYSCSGLTTKFSSLPSLPSSLPFSLYSPIPSLPLPVCRCQVMSCGDLLSVYMW